MYFQLTSQCLEMWWSSQSFVFDINNTSWVEKSQYSVLKWIVTPPSPFTYDQTVCICTFQNNSDGLNVDNK